MGGGLPETWVGQGERGTNRATRAATASGGVMTTGTAMRIHGRTTEIILFDY